MEIDYSISLTAISFIMLMAVWMLVRIERELIKIRLMMKRKE